MMMLCPLQTQERLGPLVNNQLIVEYLSKVDSKISLILLSSWIWISRSDGLSNSLPRYLDKHSSWDDYVHSGDLVFLGAAPFHKCKRVHSQGFIDDLGINIRPLVLLRLVQLMQALCTVNLCTLNPAAVDSHLTDDV